MKRSPQNWIAEACRRTVRLALCTVVIAGPVSAAPPEAASRTTVAARPGQPTRQSSRRRWLSEPERNKFKAVLPASSTADVTEKSLERPAVHQTQVRRETATSAAAEPRPAVQAPTPATRPRPTAASADRTVTTPAAETGDPTTALPANQLRAHSGESSKEPAAWGMREALPTPAATQSAKSVPTPAVQDVTPSPVTPDVTKEPVVADTSQKVEPREDLVQARCVLRLMNTLGVKDLQPESETAGGPGASFLAAPKLAATEPRIAAPEFAVPQPADRESSWRPSEAHAEPIEQIEQIEQNSLRAAAAESNNRPSGGDDAWQSGELKRNTADGDDTVDRGSSDELHAASELDGSPAQDSTLDSTGTETPPAAFEVARQQPEERTPVDFRVSDVTPSQPTSKPAPTVPAPATLAEMGSSAGQGVTHRVMDDRGGEEVEEVAGQAAEPTEPGNIETPFSTPPAAAIATASPRADGTSEDATSSHANEQQDSTSRSGFSIRNRLKNAIDQMVAGPGKKETNSLRAMPADPVSERAQPQPALLSDLLERNGQPRPAAEATPHARPTELAGVEPPKPLEPLHPADKPPTFHVVGDRDRGAHSDRPRETSRLVNRADAPESRGQLPEFARVTASPVSPVHTSELSNSRPTHQDLPQSFSTNGNLPEVRLATRTSYPLRAPGRVARVKIVDRSVCDVVHHSPYELALVGKHEGQTEVAIWLDGQPSAQVYRIVVGSGDGVEPDEGKLERLLADLFPESRIEITQQHGNVLVDGNAKDRQEAIQILSVVRSVKLVPVIDQLQVIRR